MSTAVRPPKSGGTTRYTDEVARGFDVIKATEVDGDLDMLVQVVNNLTDANVANGASIDGKKVGTGTLPADRIVPGTITDTQISNTANINGTKLLTNSVPGAKLKDKDVPTAKLAVNASTAQVPVTALVADSLSIFGPAEITVVTASITTRGGYVRVTGTWALRCQVQGNVSNVGSVTVLLKRDGTGLFGLEAPLISPTGSLLQFLAIPMPVPWIDTFAGVVTPAGLHTYTITVRTSGANYVAFTPANAFGAGGMQLEEVA